MAFQDYQVTAAGDRKVIHNGVRVHAGRKLSLDSAATATVAAVKEGYLASVTSATAYDDGVSSLQTYTVQAAWSKKLLHNGAVLASGSTLALDPLEASTVALLARGVIA